MRDVAVLVKSMATLEQDVPGGFLQAAQRALRPRLAEAGGADMADLLWGLAMLRSQLQPPFMEAFTVCPPMPVPWPFGRMTRTCSFAGCTC